MSRDYEKKKEAMRARAKTPHAKVWHKANPERAKANAAAWANNNKELKKIYRHTRRLQHRRQHPTFTQKVQPSKND
jgi:hypothetical protein